MRARGQLYCDSLLALRSDFRAERPSANISRMHELRAVHSRIRGFIRGRPPPAQKQDFRSLSNLGSLFPFRIEIYAATVSNATFNRVDAGRM